jgi:DNA processing protein
MAPRANIESWVALSMVPEVGTVTYRKLLSVYGSPEIVFQAPIEELSRIEGVGEKRARNIKEFDGWKCVENQFARLNQIGGRIITFENPEYPAMLRQIDHVPVLLYVKGNVIDEDRFAIGIVGSRRPTHYGRIVTEKLSSELAAAGFTIVSGMARGIDSIAHKGTLVAGGRTIAVLGCGIDKPYPPENRDLMEKISMKGCIVSEFPLGTPPNREHFPARNRLISGLSLGVLVVEATRESGALITAHHALAQNREVFAIPGNITSQNSTGTNDLIKKGATLVQDVDDIIGDLAPMLKGYVRVRERVKIEVNDEEKRLCDILTGEPMHVDVIARSLSVSPSKVLALLLSLELKGVARQAEGKRFYLVQ